MARRGHTLRRRYGRTHEEHSVLRPGQRVLVPHADGTEEGVVVERGDGGFNLKRRLHDPYVVLITQGMDAGSEAFPIARAHLFLDPLAASIESARLHEEAMRD